MKTHASMRRAFSGYMPIVQSAIVFASASLFLQVLAIPREQPIRRTFELTAGWSDPDAEEIESFSICPHFVQPRLPPLAVATMLHEADWIPELTVELDLTACDDWPALPIGAEHIGSEHEE